MRRRDDKSGITTQLYSSPRDDRGRRDFGEQVDGNIVANEDVGGEFCEPTTVVPAVEADGNSVFRLSVHFEHVAGKAMRDLNDGQVVQTTESGLHWGTDT